MHTRSRAAADRLRHLRMTWRRRILDLEIDLRRLIPRVVALLALVIASVFAVASVQAQVGTVDSITVKWRDDALPPGATGIPDALLGALASTLHADTTVIGRNRDGAFRLQLGSPQSIDDARAAINRVRMSLPVTYVGLGPPAHDAQSAAALAEQPPAARDPAHGQVSRPHPDLDLSAERNAGPNEPGRAQRALRSTGGERAGDGRWRLRRAPVPGAPAGAGAGACRKSRSRSDHRICRCRLARGRFDRAQRHAVRIEPVGSPDPGQPRQRAGRSQHAAGVELEHRIGRRSRGGHRHRHPAAPRSRRPLSHRLRHDRRPDRRERRRRARRRSDRSRRLAHPDGHKQFSAEIQRLPDRQQFLARYACVGNDRCDRQQFDRRRRHQLGEQDSAGAGAGEMRR